MSCAPRPGGNADRSRFELYQPVTPRPGSGWLLDTLVPPSRLFSSNGIRWGPDGCLWISEFNGEQVSGWDPSTDTLTIRSAMGNVLKGPDDIAFDAAGGYYVAETMNARVTGRRADGEYVVLLDDAPGANGITFDPSTDQLYVDEMREGGRVLKVDHTRPGAYEVLAEGLAWCNAMEVSPTGELCLPQVFAGTVLAIDLATLDIRILTDELQLPTAVKFDDRGRLVVSEAGAGELTAIDLETNTRETLARPGPGIDNFCFDPAGQLYLSNYCEAKVEQYVDGRLGRVLSPGGLIGPYQIAAAGSDALVVADANSIVSIGPDRRLDRLTRLLVDQAFVVVGLARIGPDLLALSGAGDVFSIRPGQPIVKVIEATGDSTSQYLSTARAGASAVGSDDGTGLVALVSGDIVEMSADGQTHAVTASGLAAISAVDRSRGLLVACDEDAGDIVIIGPEGTRRVGGLARPQAIAVGPDGVFVAEVGSRQVSWLSPDGARREVVCDDLPLGMPVPGVEHTRRCSLAHLGDGRVAVGCDGDGSIRVVRRS